MILAARGMFLSRLTTQTIAPCTIRAEVVKVVVKSKENRNKNSCILVNDNTDNVATKSYGEADRSNECEIRTSLVAKEMKLV